MRVSKVAEYTQSVLEEFPQTRDDLFLLYINVCKKMNLSCAISLDELGRLHNKLGYPAFDSVKRARAKIWEFRPDLKGTEEGQKKRDEHQEEILNFVKGWKAE